MTDNTQNIKYRESDYLYGTARVRALEKRLLSLAAIARALDAPDLDGALSAFREAGIPLDAENIEASLSAILAEAFDECEAMAADKRTIDILRYPYDAHNVKSAIKCNIRGVDAARLMSEVGSVPTADILKMPGTGDYSLLPENMARAAAQAVADHAATRDPQALDVIIDRACYMDMAALAANIGDGFFAKYVTAKIDTTNILTAVRVIRMSGADVDMDYLERVLLPGGKLSFDLFRETLGDGETALWQRLALTEYEPLVRVIDAEGKFSLTFIEKICEDHCLGIAKEEKSRLASAGAVAAYAIATEYMVKDIRIITVGKQSGTDNDTVRERIRDTYV